MPLTVSESRLTSSSPSSTLATSPKGLSSVRVAVISSDFQSEEHGFESRTEYSNNKGNIVAKKNQKDKIEKKPFVVSAFNVQDKEVYNEGYNTEQAAQVAANIVLRRNKVKTVRINGRHFKSAR